MFLWDHEVRTRIACATLRRPEYARRYLTVRAAFIVG
jgi:hypothetical protein